jgi:arabinoxylan arabinofuranohydrolase
MLKKTFVVTVSALAALFAGCPQDVEEKPVKPEDPDAELEEFYAPDTNQPPEEAALFDDLTLATPYKEYGNHNPVMSQWFGADPWALEYGGRIYLYMSDDHYPNYAYNPQGPSGNNDYSTLRSVHVVSSADMVNWTDHGLILVAGSGGIASWASQAFAPCAAWKTINGQDWFFIYVGNNANGVYVIKGTGPTPQATWTDPNGGMLVTRTTPGCDSPTWCFDPAILIDDDGSAYLYFGGGVSGDGQPMENRPIADPGTARVVKLNGDMVSRAEDVGKIPYVPYLLEDFGINKLNGKYYLSYCANSQHPEGRTSINYLVSGSPYGPFANEAAKWPLEEGEEKVVESKLMMKNPVDFGMTFTNNHHAMFRFGNRYYMAYQTVELEDEMARQLGYASDGAAPDGKSGYRSTSIDQVTISGGTIRPVQITLQGVAQMISLDPYVVTEAETIGVQAGITTVADTAASGGMKVSGVDSGDWFAVYGVGFGSQGAARVKVRVKRTSADKGVIQIREDGREGRPIGYVVIDGGMPGTFQEYEAELLRRVAAKNRHDVVFVFQGSGYELDTWVFEH